MTTLPSPTVAQLRREMARLEIELEAARQRLVDARRKHEREISRLLRRGKKQAHFAAAAIREAAAVSAFQELCGDANCTASMCDGRSVPAAIRALPIVLTPVVMHADS